MVPRINVVDRFWSKVVKTEEGCWLWIGPRTDKGYGRIGLIVANEAPTMAAHRFSYIIHKGDIPKGLVIDHLCRVHNCVNPDHLEVVTTLENLRRGESAFAKIYRTNICNKGHPLSPENTNITPQGYRRCRICGKEKMRKHRANKKDKSNDTS